MMKSKAFWAFAGCRDVSHFNQRASVDARCSSYLVGTSRKRKVLCADSHLCH
jgi:hypothetical protein